MGKNWSKIWRTFLPHVITFVVVYILIAVTNFFSGPQWTGVPWGDVSEPTNATHQVLKTLFFVFSWSLYAIGIWFLVTIYFFIKKEGNYEVGEKLVTWIFKIQAIYLVIAFGIAFLIPLGGPRAATIVWLLFGIGIWFIANGIRDEKNWAPITALFGSTLPYIVLSVIMNVLQRAYFIFEGSKNPDIFAMSSQFWVFFVTNLALSIILISVKGTLNHQTKK